VVTIRRSLVNTFLVVIIPGLPDLPTRDSKGCSLNRGGFLEKSKHPQLQIGEGIAGEFDLHLGLDCILDCSCKRTEKKYMFYPLRTATEDTTVLIRYTTFPQLYPGWKTIVDHPPNDKLHLLRAFDGPDRLPALVLGSKVGGVPSCLDTSFGKERTSSFHAIGRPHRVLHLYRFIGPETTTRFLRIARP
jgi:hypothetical protein